MGRRWLALPLVLLGLLAGGMPAAQAHQDGQDGSRGASSVPAAWRHQFDYRPTRIQVTEVGRETRGSVVVHDIRYQAPGQDAVTAYLVTPKVAGRHPAVLFLHWLGEVNADRHEFLDEAVDLAAGPGHLVSLLPNLEFPFAYGPVGDVRDRDSVVKQVVQLRRGLDLLGARSDVADGRVAVVGHDYGAMFGSMLAAVDRARVQASVTMAADATMANWFVRFFLDLPADQVEAYAAMLRSVDPVRYLGAGPRRQLLQYAVDDFFIPQSVASAMSDAAPPTAIYRHYATDHQLALPTVRADRDDFLTAALR